MPPIAQAPTVAFNDGTQIPQLGFGVFMIDAADTEVLVSTALAAGTSTPPRPTATSPRVGKATRGLAQHVSVTTKYFNRTSAAAAARRLGCSPSGPAPRPRASRLDRL